mgnify:CR=1 FL=1
MCKRDRTWVVADKMASCSGDALVPTAYYGARGDARGDKPPAARRQEQYTPGQQPMRPRPWLLFTSPIPRDRTSSRMPSSAL